MRISGIKTKSKKKNGEENDLPTSLYIFLTPAFPFPLVKLSSFVATRAYGPATLYPV